jgi:protein involved in polysaccharide export with SLBB domain
VSFAGAVIPSAQGVSGYRRPVLRLLLVFLACLAPGCGDNVRTPTAEELAAFDQAGPVQPSVDVNLLRKARLHTGPYRVVADDVLGFTMPALLQAVTTTEAQTAQAQIRDDRPYVCRVSKRGTISLPAVGELEVVGQTLAEIEEKVVDAYGHYVVVRPSVYVRLQEYKTYRTSIIGAVAKPGVYLLRGDQMSVVALLMEAGGIVEEGATVIKISRPNQADAGSFQKPETPGQQSSTTSQSTEQKGRLAVLQREIAAPPTDLSNPDTVQVTFKREGPLPGTGWLTLRTSKEVLARKWFDIDNTPQRQTFLATVATRLNPVALNDIQAKISSLAGWLEASSQDGQTEPAMAAAGWQKEPGDQFVAYVPSHPADADPGASVARKVVTETTVAAGEDTVTTLVLPVRGLNIPFRDVGLVEGDTVVVERAQEPLFSVLGLVARAGNFPYPPNIQYNVAQAIAFAGGLEPASDPRYVTIYRLAKDGSIVRVPLKLVDKDQFTEALNTKIKPGDVVAIEHTPRTRANTMIHDLVRINTGIYVTGNDLWNRN